jgi:hypothetical protein
MYQYASNRKDASSIRHDRPLTADEIFRAAPSVFATEAHASRSERYGFIPTFDVLQGLRREGFEPFEARQTKVRDLSKRSFTRHMLRLRHPDAPAHDGISPEIILLNSHDGSSGYQLLSGFFRFVCSNGLIVGDICDDVRVRHSTNVGATVLDGCIKVLDNVRDAAERIQLYKSIGLTPHQQQAFAAAALELKYENAPINSTALLLPRRWEDNSSDLWTTFNRVQENLTKGGIRGRSANGRRTTTRAVTGVDQDVKLNRALWTLADRLGEAVRGATWMGTDELTPSELRLLETV